VPTRLVAHDVSVPLRDAVGSPLPVSDDDEHDRGSFRAVPWRVAQNPPTAHDPVRQVSFAGARIPAPTTGFDGHDFPGASVPPDPNGDVGATQYVQATNRGYTVFSKSGTTLLTRTPADTQTVRNVFVIGPDKKIKLMLIYPMTTGRNFDEVLRVIDSLQLTATHKVSTPVNWKHGEDVIIAGSVNDEQAKELFGTWDAPKPFASASA